MPNRLALAISPYLRSHADNPVDWFPWGEEAFAEAERRDVPVLVSIGYSTCHSCHVMARESFSNAALADVLNDGFVAIKVDREEHPEVDAFFLAAAGAFTQNLGWPLNVFTTPAGRPFFAGTYFPPAAVQGTPAFETVLGAVREAFTERRTEVEQTGEQLVAALSRPDATRAAAEDDVAARGEATADAGNAPERVAALAALPSEASFAQVIAELEAYEDTVHGGFGGAPKFPVAPVLGFLLAAESPVAQRTLEAMAASDLRDEVEGGFFRYATRADWSEPHYERMLYDNALLLDAYTSASQSAADVGAWARATAEGIARFLIEVLQVDGGGFASAQDSESIVDGKQSEGGYYALDAHGRSREVAPKRDEKILTGWNGLAIAALARFGTIFDDERAVRAAVQAADYLIANHVRGDGSLLRASLGARTSDARATLEDYGMFATALGILGTVTGDEQYTRLGRQLVDTVIVADPNLDSVTATVFAVPGGGDPVLARRGLIADGDLSEGAYPSGLSAVSRAALNIAVATGDGWYADLALAALAPVAVDALARPIGYGTVLELLFRLRRAS